MYPVLYIPNADGNGGKRYDVSTVTYYKNKVSSVMYKDEGVFKTVYDKSDVVGSEFQLDLSECLTFECRYDNLVKKIQSDIELELKSSNKMANSIAQSVVAGEQVGSTLIKDYIELQGIVAGKYEVLDHLV